jgi:dihydroorotate dehydrogenase electron transfer subunit
LRQTVATVISNEQLWGEHWILGHLKFLGAWLIWLKCPEIASEVKPGQFIMVNCGEECLLPRPFSIHQVNDDGIALFYAVLVDGKGTNWLSRCKNGDTLKLPSPHPLGNGFSVAPSSNNLLLVAGGNGIAPLYFLAQDALKGKRSVTLLYGTAENKRLSIPPPIKLVSATEDGTVGHKGVITDILPDYINGADQVFACGPLLMYRAMAQMPKLRNKPVQLSLEVRMGCGLGVCYGCTVKTKNGLKQVCKDGPVFNLSDILWEELRGV